MSSQVFTGTCNCGGVAFEVRGERHGIFVCHCSICRKWTGSHGVAIVVVSKADFRWTRGNAQLRAWHKPGHDWMSAFCGVCGSSLPVDNDGERMAIPAGLFDDDARGLDVQHHIWVDSRAPWDVIGDGGQQHSGPFGSDVPSG